MSPPVSVPSRRGVSSHDVIELDDGWEYATLASPGATTATDAEWTSIGARTTAAGARRRLGTWSLDDVAPTDFDVEDHAFRCTVALVPVAGGERVLLELDGIATISEVLWNGVEVATARSMFEPITIDVTASVLAANVLEIRCRSLLTWLGAHKQPRARWKTKLVTDQRLRSVRTTLLGRIPSWSPPVTVVGPWRPVRIVRKRAISVERLSVRQTVDAVRIELDLGSLDGIEVVGARVELADRSASLELCEQEGCETLAGTVATGGLARWWPHTHGEPAQHDLRIRLERGDGTVVTIDAGKLGLREISVDQGPDGRGFGLVVNGDAVFCRGGAMMPLDPATFMASPAELSEVLTTARDAGCNMVRVSGTAAYEQPAFFAACDELGILVWHDLPFANFDYPRDPEFAAVVRREVGRFLDGTQTSASLAVVCGGSEIEQQAAMLGLGSEVLDDSLARTVIADVMAERRPDLVYVPSSPSGGHLPFANDHGVNHYFGVGAYLRPLTDARHAQVRFASECLAFANVPVPAAVTELLGEHETAPTSPRWKARVPRDRGTGWDFDDVRDHYVNELFGIDPKALRWADPARYLAVGRAASAEILKRVFSEWRRPGSSCRGGLVWFLNDLWTGAGWGLIDAQGRPKAALHGMAQVLQPVSLFCLDEGLNGLDLWVCNDTAVPVEGRVEVQALRDGSTIVASGAVDVTAPARGGVRVRADDAFGRFTDPTYAYRFGPPAHDLIAARLVGVDGRVLSRTTYTPPGLPLSIERGVGLTATASWIDSATLAIETSSVRVARFVTIDVPGGRLLADHVDLVPGDPQTLLVRFRSDAAVPMRAYVSALNADTEAVVTVPPRQP